MPQSKVELKDLLEAKFDYNPTHWKDEIKDPEGDIIQHPTPYTARRANNFEQGIDLAHDRLNDVVDYLEESDRIQKNLRFEFLLLKASVTSGLTSNIFVDNFETLDGINLTAGAHDPQLQRIYLP